MSESKECPKCSGSMTLGSLKEKGLYGPSPYVWAPSDDAPFPAKGIPSKRRDVVMYRCEKCDFLELYAPSTS
jgi:ssDNA-binding Zn-finger/Zn-ribbon topoisomerase 1